MKKHPAFDDDAADLPDPAELPVPGTSPISHLILQHLQMNYAPAESPRDSLNLTTEEIYERLSRFNALDFGPAWLGERLLQLGYQVHDLGGMRFVWLIKEL